MQLIPFQWPLRYASACVSQRTQVTAHYTSKSSSLVIVYKFICRDLHLVTSQHIVQQLMWSFSQSTKWKSVGLVINMSSPANRFSNICVIGLLSRFTFRNEVLELAQLGHSSRHIDSLAFTRQVSQFSLIAILCLYIDYKDMDEQLTWYNQSYDRLTKHI